MLMTPLTDPPTPPKPGATALAPAPPKACSRVKVSPLKVNVAAAFSVSRSIVPLTLPPKPFAEVSSLGPAARPLAIGLS